jgi:REP element-mobilizing transposase RayT
VWVPRYRRKLLVEGVTKDLWVKLLEVRKHDPDWQSTEVGIDKDYVHVHMVIPPKDRVNFVVETIKKNSSRTLCMKFRFLDNVYWDCGNVWSTVGITEEIISR